MDMVQNEDFVQTIRFKVPDIVRNPVVARLEALYKQHALDD
ncbi:hypothetical protein V0U79_06045 [Hyphobacterium sp. HN65]|uniref:Uncharacterized protein n=1 Tax=Hyphobacterium lacteum TaxID=3116575 RepID=A0ABU7LPS8_9PROT|nr:hypothetical protein [Hyphobacterium sp. HN65]MEE2525920.1 hypothetical protein [Hyphobacterium sp. HN65]